MPKLVLVQVLRALAALAVAMLHAQHDAEALAARTGQAFARADWLPWTAGVDVFFVISGFIMVYASGRLFASPGGARTFLARRVARIVPIYWAVTTVYLLLALAAPRLLNSEVLGLWPVAASYLFIPFERPGGLVQPLYSLGWTLNYEMYFYALFALALALPRRGAVMVLVPTMAGLALAGQALAPLSQPLAFWTDPIILEFAFGMMLGLARAEGLTLNALTRLAFVAAGLVLLALDLTRADALITLPRFLAYGLPATLLVAAAAFGTPGREGRLTRVGESLGDASYALYLIHPFVIRGGRELTLQLGLAPLIGPWGFVTLALLGASLAALVVYRLFERPATGWARSLLEPRR